MTQWLRTTAMRARIVYLTAGVFGAFTLGMSYTSWASNLDANGIIEKYGLREQARPLRDFPGWKKPHKIIVKVDSPDRAAWISSVAKDVTIVPVRSEQEVIQALATNPDADAIVSILCGELGNPSIYTPELLRKAVAAKNMRWIHISGAGIEGCSAVPNIGRSKIVFTNMQRVNAGAIAEQSMALLLEMTRGMDRALGLQHAQVWRQPANRMIELDGRTMLIVGLGGIGLEVAQRAHAFGMRIVATRNTGREKPDYVDYVGGPGEYRALSERADVVVNATPLTPETTHMFDAPFFAHAKQGMYFINVGRGESVVSSELIGALRSGQVAGAGLDVTDPEPLAPDDPLWTAPNVVITAHAATTSDMRAERFWLVNREQIRRFVAGDKLLSVVDLNRGY